MKGLMISAMSSSGGKTVLTCGLLAALKSRELDVRAFKCGPDYIDPMFHTRVLNVPSRNLDLFLQGEAGARRTLSRAAEADFALVEGAMGFYDGLKGTDRASAWDAARMLGLPVLLALRPKGASLTLAAQVRGMLGFRKPCHIVGLFLTDCKPSLHAHLAPILERETGLPVLGYLPTMEEAVLPSRHLGLLTAGEIEDLSARFSAVGKMLTQKADLDALASLAAELDCLEIRKDPVSFRCTIAVARDEAFCFCYEDNLDALREAGANLIFFSPFYDTCLPMADGLYLPGGYPELYARQLSGNTAMRKSVRRAVKAGLPTVAECGGFLYLQRTLEDGQGSVWPMARAFSGAGFQTDRLQRFGYKELSAEADSLLLRKGERLPVHEFHYWDSTEPDMVLAQNIYAGFPHLHFGGELPMAKRFVESAVEWRRTHG